MLAWSSVGGACAFGCASDQWATARLQPSVDAAQSLTNVRGGFEGAYMKATFERPLAASDAQDSAIDIAASDTVIWAVHDTDVPTASDGSAYLKHTLSGALSVTWSAAGCAGPPTAAPTPAPTPA